MITYKNIIILQLKIITNQTEYEKKTKLKIVSKHFN